MALDLRHRIRTAKLPSGEAVTALGQGTWGLAEDARRRNDELAALRAGLDLGMTLIDTAEMYADGEAEVLVGEAIEGRRDKVFLVSKVLPHNATTRGTITACQRSLRRLRTDRLDLYLLHWRGSKPLEATLDGFCELIRTGLIRYWGVSNFDIADMSELVRLPGGDAVATDQVIYNLARRGIDSPIEQGRLLGQRELRDIAARHAATPAQIALAWLIRREDVIAIPKASSIAHTKENHAALDVRLTEQDLVELDHAFPPPAGPQPLDML